MQVNTMSKAEFELHKKNAQIYYSFFESPAGKITILMTDLGIFQATFDEINLENYKYLHNTQLNKLLLIGTEFQTKVWKKLLTLEQVITYSQLAESMNLPYSTRAVASVVAKNNIALLVPCHKIVHKDEKKSNYRWGIERKKILINFKDNYTTPGGGGGFAPRSAKYKLFNALQPL